MKRVALKMYRYEDSPFGTRGQRGGKQVEVGRGKGTPSKSEPDKRGTIKRPEKATTSSVPGVIYENGTRDSAKRHRQRALRDHR